MRVRLLFPALLLSATLFAQSSPAPCPASLPVDDIIAEINKQQSKKNNRTKNPLPDSICIFGLCTGTAKRPQSRPPSSPPADTPASASDTSSSRTDLDKCQAAMDRALEAAHNVDVGDYYFEQKNYRAALLRYQDAATEKTGDIAIHVRMGRALEKLNKVPEALDQYNTAVKLTGPEKWSLEARAAIARLQAAERQ